MKREAFLAEMGATENVNYTSRKARYPSIYCFEPVEFYFEEEKEGRLRGIQISPFWQREDAPIAVDLFEGKTGLTEIKKYLEKWKVNYKKSPCKWDEEDSTRLLTQGKVELIFGTDEIGDWHFLKLFKFIELERQGPRMKQISCSINEETYKKIQQQSIAQRRSMASIIQKIIEQNV